MSHEIYVDRDGNRIPYPPINLRTLRKLKYPIIAEGYRDFCHDGRFSPEAPYRNEEDLVERREITSWREFWEMAYGPGYDQIEGRFSCRILKRVEDGKAVVQFHWGWKE